MTDELLIVIIIQFIVLGELRWMWKGWKNDLVLKKENYELHKRLGDFEPFEEHMKERTSKTSVNYIVGLAKTDESTDIVELKRGWKNDWM